MQPAEGRVLFCQAGSSGGHPDFGPDFLTRLEKSFQEVFPSAGRASQWMLKTDLSAPGKPPSVPPALLQVVRQVISRRQGGKVPVFGTLSISTEGLHTVEALEARAAGLEISDFQVGEDPDDRGPELSDPAFSLPTVTLSRLAAEAEGILLVNPVRPHPHLGMAGALPSLGLGLLERDSKLLLHRDIRPRVDTPLCAGCGSCLGVCLYDAINIKGGRAMIDHQLCTGCGECMSACHLAGISPEQPGGVLRFQKQVAEAASLVTRPVNPGKPRFFWHLNVLTPVIRHDRGGFSHGSLQVPPCGVLLSPDPVALDQATWDILTTGQPGGLRQWGGYAADPEELLTQASALGLGSRTYHLDHQN